MGEAVHVIEKWPNGRVKRDFFTVEDGSMVGIERVYYEDGLPEIVCHRRYGKLDGEYISYGSSGAMRLKTNYKNDLLDGLCEEYDEKGLIQKMTVYQDGKKHGMEQTFFENRLLSSSCTYQYDQMNGHYEEYYENGLKKFSYYYFRDMLHGPYIHFYNTGKKCYELEYQNGLIHGLYTEYYLEQDIEHNVGSYCEKGIAYELQKKHGKKLECTYRQGSYHGKFTAWDEEGEIMQENFYWNGLAIPKVIFDLYQTTSGVLMGIA
jgi:antitoxin component YwqK of YwqJK toxin-antitoxin module